MIFNSIPFAIFLPVVFILYWLIGSKRKEGQNAFLLLASLFFYGWWDYRFLLLLLSSISIGYLFGIWLEKSISHRRIILFLGLSLILSSLLFFKYYNFFIENFAHAYSLFGGKLQVQSLSLILPLGISFYTFKLIGYVVDVYYRKIERCKSPLDFYLFVSFFPQISAGPLESSITLLPQIQRERLFDYTQAKEGLKHILWGLFKKIAIADTCANYANDIFGNYEYFPGSMLVLGVFYFTIQVYADFSGYSDIAIGIGKLFGFELMKNFNLPFLSKNVTDFWRRWHISLTLWFNNYFFSPIYVSIRAWGVFAMYVSIFLTFLLSGLWHGASWNYILYGALQGTAIIVETRLSKQRKTWQKKLNKTVYFNLSIGITMVFVLFTFVIFRSNDIPSAMNYLNRIASWSLFEIPGKLAYLPIIFVMLSWEWLQRKKSHAMNILHLPVGLRWGIYTILTFFILYYYGQDQEFYYFQF